MTCSGVTAVLRETVEGARYFDLLLLLVDPLDLGNSPNPPDRRLDPLGIIFQFAVAVAVAVNRQQNRNRIAEVVIDDRALHAVGKIRLLQLRHVETQLGPELLRVLEVVFQLDIDEHDAVHAGRVGLSRAVRLRS